MECIVWTNNNTTKVCIKSQSNASIGSRNIQGIVDFWKIFYVKKGDNFVKSKVRVMGHDMWTGLLSIKTYNK